MTGNTAHFSHAFFMKFFSEFQWTNISSDDIIVDVVQPECSANTELHLLLTCCERLAKRKISIIFQAIKIK